MMLCDSLTLVDIHKGATYFASKKERNKEAKIRESEEIPSESIERGERTKDYKRTWEI